MITVTTYDEDLDESELAVLDGVSHILVVNTEAGYYLDGEAHHQNGTIVITLKCDEDKRKAYVEEHRG